MLLPFGQTVRVWRQHRGMTQQALAAAARLPRPNLSAIERGEREVTLATLRALAAALDVNPGRLADGTPPQPEQAVRLSRKAMERIAEAAIAHRRLPNPAEAALASWLGELVEQRRQVLRGRRSALRGRRRVRAAWLQLAAACPPQVVHSLFERAENRLSIHGSTTD